MINLNPGLYTNLSKEVVDEITGFQLSAFLVALEGWRRGLTLTWYKAETEICELHRLNSSTNGKFFSLSNDKRKHYFFRSRGDKVSNEAVILCQNKQKTKKMLEKNNVPVPKGKIFNINNKDKILDYALEIGFPVIIKPLFGSMGTGVFTNINSVEELEKIVDSVKSKYTYKRYLVEKHYFGNEYRVYVVGDKVAGAIHRVPANVTGDGIHTIQELIDIKNKERQKIPYLSTKLIKVDYEVEKCLQRKNYNLDSIPENGELVYLRDVSNVNSGGDPVDATDELSTEVKQVAINTLKALPSIPHAGLDIIVDPNDNTKCVVLEVNATADIGMHSFPIKGKARNVPGAIIDYYFPETIDKEKSDFYFDYKVLLNPLDTWLADEIKITKPPIGKIYGKRYIVSGKIKNVGYMKWIKRQALLKNLHGYTKYISNDTIEVFVISKDKQLLDDFEERCYKGSKKSKVENVESEVVDIKPGTPFEVGFKIISDN